MIKKTRRQPVGNPEWAGLWIDDPLHRAYLRQDVQRQLDFFRPMLRGDGGFDVPDFEGNPLDSGIQELHTTTRMVHSFALGKQFGFSDCDDVIDAGMAYLWNNHRDCTYGGYFAAMSHGGGTADDTKLAYGHMFVLLAATTAKEAGHPGADRLLADVDNILQDRFWERKHHRYADEFRADWTPFSTYRGLNANMHGVEALLAAFEATNDSAYLDCAGGILAFFFDELAPRHDWRLPEHFHEDWTVDASYEGNPMFRPAGTTPGHSFELGRLMLHHWDLNKREDPQAPEKAKRVIASALVQGAHPEGGFVYTLEEGKISKPDRYWWPVAEAINALAAVQKIDPSPEIETQYRALWRFADRHFIDHSLGGWFPEIDETGNHVSKQFVGKPDIYHSIQAGLFPPVKRLSRLAKSRWSGR